MSRFFKICFFHVLVYFSVFSIGALEIRAIIHDSLSARVDLMREKATYRGDYAFNDCTYSNGNSGNTLNGEFYNQ